MTKSELTYQEKASLMDLTNRVYFELRDLEDFINLELDEPTGSLSCWLEAINKKLISKFHLTEPRLSPEYEKSSVPGNQRLIGFKWTSTTTGLRRGGMAELHNLLVVLSAPGVLTLEGKELYTAGKVSRASV